MAKSYIRSSLVPRIRPIFRVRFRPVSVDFNHFFAQLATEYDGDLSHPNSGRVYSRLGGTADLADFQGPIARLVSLDFRHFFTQPATEYDGDPIPTVAENSGLGAILPIRSILKVRSPDPFLTIFAIFH